MHKEHLRSNHARCRYGISYDYEQGKAYITRLTWDNTARQLSTAAEGDKAFALNLSQVQIIT